MSKPKRMPSHRPIPGLDRQAESNCDDAEFIICSDPATGHEIFLPRSLLGLLDVSSGFENIGEPSAEQVDDGDVGGGFSVTARPGACGLEDAVERLQARIRV